VFVGDTANGVAAIGLAAAGAVGIVLTSTVGRTRPS